jgi:tetratricopeptide (TPR) repeat protein
MTDDDAELASLDAIIVESDGRDDPTARWDAAEALYSKAEIIDRRDGPAAALEVYHEVARRLEGVRDDAPRELRLCALHDVAMIYQQLGYKAESQKVAEELLSEFFEDPPSEGSGEVVSGAVLLAELLSDAGEYDRTLELLERVIDRYGQPGVPNHHWIAASANASIAGVLAASGRVEEGIRRFEWVIQALGEPTEDVPRRILANAMGKQAQLLYDTNRPKIADARCRQIVQRFADDEHPEIADQVDWARASLDYSKRYARRRQWPRR